MKSPNFLQGVLVAVSLAATAGLMFETLASIIPTGALARDLVLVCAGAYVLYLLRRPQRVAGRVATFVLFAIIAAATWLLAPSFIVFVMVQTSLIWLVRVIYYHRTFFGACADFALSSTALAASVATLNHTNSFFLTVWVYFLVQALFVFLPSAQLARSSDVTTATDKFEYASRSAEEAIRKLSIQSH